MDNGIESAFDKFMDGDFVGSKKELAEVVRYRVNDHLKDKLGLSGDAMDIEDIHTDSEFEEEEE